eukprot:3936904-Rhodomonas_salina.1
MALDNTGVDSAELLAKVKIKCIYGICRNQLHLSKMLLQFQPHMHSTELAYAATRAGPATSPSRTTGPFNR